MTDRNYDPTPYWEQRYERLDLRNSGHRDLPEAYNRWLYRRKQSVLAGALRRSGFLVRGSRVLEVGAGTGAYLDFWKQQGVASLTGIDLSRAAVDFVRARFPEFAFAQCDITGQVNAIDRGPGFDLVTALDVLYHIVDDDLLAAALANVRALLRPGGYFVLHDQFLHGPTEHHGYIRWRSLADWQRSLAEAGFEIAHRTAIFFLMIQPSDVRTKWGAAFMNGLWGLSNRCIQRAPTTAGAILFATDAALGKVLREGPSMELVVARRRT